jgi:hypothetical protein
LPALSSKTECRKTPRKSPPDLTTSNTTFDINSEYVDGRIELQTSGTCLPYTTYDRLPEVSQGAIVENKRLGHVLQVAQLVQAERDSRRSQSAPARTHRGLQSTTKKPEPGKKRQRALDAKDMEKAISKAVLAT